MMTSETTPDTQARHVVAVVSGWHPGETVRISCARPLAVVACESLPESDELVRGGSMLALRAPITAISPVHSTPVLR